MILFGVTGCALFEERSGPPQSIGPRDEVFNASFEDVWKAVNLVLQPYPLRVSNMDQGILETDSLRGDKVWQPPYSGGSKNSGLSYKLSIRVVKGASPRQTKLVISKEAQVQVDFFSDPKPIPSDGMEEKTILYRVGREIQIERALMRAQKKQNQEQR